MFLISCVLNVGSFLERIFFVKFFRLLLVRGLLSIFRVIFMELDLNGCMERSIIFLLSFFVWNFRNFLQNLKYLFLEVRGKFVILNILFMLSLLFFLSFILSWQFIKFIRMFSGNSLIFFFGVLRVIKYLGFRISLFKYMR